MPRYIVPHHGGLKYVRAIPKDVQQLEGRKVWTAYLGKISGNDAKTRALELAAEHDKRAKVLRNLPETDKRLLRSKGGLARCEHDAAHADYLAAVLWPYTDGKPQTDEAKRKTDTARRTVASLLEAHAPTHNIVAKINGKPGIAPPRLFDLVTLHEKTCRDDNTPKRERIYVRRFVEIVGDLAAPDVTRAHVIAFRDALEAQGVKPGNVGVHLAKINTLFRVGLSEGIVTSNPADGVKARAKPDSKFADQEGKSFTSAQVKRIFAALDGETADFQWIIRLLAYHGMRGGEVCQLRCSDVTTLHGVPVLRIHDRHGRIKNRQSVRDIPIHPKCRGIIAYAAKVVKEHGADAWLFPSKKGRVHGFQTYANGRFLREKVGIVDRQPGHREHDQTIHSLRHTFSTLCREVGMPDVLKYALMGHALGKGEGGKYGEGPSLKLRAKWIAKVDPLKGCSGRASSIR